MKSKRQMPSKWRAPNTRRDTWYTNSLHPARLHLRFFLRLDFSGAVASPLQIRIVPRRFSRTSGRRRSQADATRRRSRCTRTAIPCLPPPTRLTVLGGELRSPLRSAGAFNVILLFTIDHLRSAICNVKSPISNRQPQIVHPQALTHRRDIILQRIHNGGLPFAPSSGRPIPLHPQRMAARPGGRLRAGRRPALRPHELHQLDGRSHGLARAADVCHAASGSDPFPAT